MPLSRQSEGWRLNIGADYNMVTVAEKGEE